MYVRDRQENLVEEWSAPYLVSRRRGGHRECLGGKSTLPAAGAPDTGPLGDKRMGRVESTDPLGTRGLGHSQSGSGRPGPPCLWSS